MALTDHFPTGFKWRELVEEAPFTPKFMNLDYISRIHSNLCLFDTFSRFEINWKVASECQLSLDRLYLYTLSFWIQILRMFSDGGLQHLLNIPVKFYHHVYWHLENEYRYRVKIIESMPTVWLFRIGVHVFGTRPTSLQSLISPILLLVSFYLNQSMSRNSEWSLWISSGNWAPINIFYGIKNVIFMTRPS